MERLFCVGIGFVIAVVLIAVYFLVTDTVKNRRAANELRLKAIAKKECDRIMGSIYWHNVMGFDAHVNALIDSRLAEKEGEHETAEL